MHFHVQIHIEGNAYTRAAVSQKTGIPSAAYKLLTIG